MVFYSIWYVHVLVSISESGELSWGNWMNWTSCTAACGGGTQIRVKICQGVSPGGCTHTISVQSGVILG